NSVRLPNRGPHLGRTASRGVIGNSVAGAGPATLPQIHPNDELWHDRAAVLVGVAGAVENQRVRIHDRLEQRARGLVADDGEIGPGPTRRRLAPSRYGRRFGPRGTGRS